MLKSLIASTKTIGTLTVKVAKGTGHGIAVGSVATAKGTKKAAVATGRGTKKATLATGRGVKQVGHYVAEEYRSNKPVEDLGTVVPVDLSNIGAVEALFAIMTNPVKVTKTRAARVRKSQAKKTEKVFEPVQ